MTTVIAEQQPVTTLPGEPVPYGIEAGSGRAHVLLGEVGRALVGAEESRGAMSVMALDGPRADRPIPLHYHDNEYEFSRPARRRPAVGRRREPCPASGRLRLRATRRGPRLPAPGPSLNVRRAGRAGRLGPLLRPDRRTVHDRRFPDRAEGPPPFERFARAEVEFKMKYRPDLEYTEAREDAADDAVPDAQQPFFLRSGEGPRHELAGQLQTLIVGAPQTSGTTTMTTVEMPKGPGLPSHVHERTYESLMVLEGRLRLTLDGDEHVLTRGDTASIPAGTAHAYAGDGHYTKVLTMSAPGGLEALIARAGQPTEEHIFSAAPATVDLAALRAAADGLDVSFV